MLVLATMRLILKYFHVLKFGIYKDCFKRML